MRRLRRAAGLALALLPILSGPPDAQAQTCAAAQAGTFTLTADQVDFNPPGVTEFEAGFIERAQNVKVRVNPDFGGGDPWTLCLRSEDPDLGVYGKPLADLEWRLDSDPTWRPLDAVDQLVDVGTGNANLRLRFRVLLSYALDEPGDYGALLAFTAYRQ